jgi:alkanesulfonate monooxygenase SsuD/methylene tetrahydromethanopterin reductase-like flavin-dependent oxidoreductase (luciferase family)
VSAGERLRLGLIATPDSRRLAVAHARLAEEAGLDSLWIGDHLRAGYLDGWSVLAAWAVLTDRIRLGVLASTMVYRDPVLLARQASAVDVLSGGRVEVALGAGELPSDHRMAGVPRWSAAGRSARFREFVPLVDGLLRGTVGDHQGRFYRCADAELVPRPVQAPRPPLTVAAYGPVTTGIAARYADTWNTFCGGMRLPDRELVAVAALRARMADRACRQLGRDPATLRKSILVAPQHLVWSSPARFTAVVAAYQAAGYRELVFYAPEPAEFAVCAAAVAGLRAQVPAP